VIEKGVNEGQEVLLNEPKGGQEMKIELISKELVNK
jgi:hypothetical protein